ncbi:MAG: radical SAM protein [Elusimicrobiota bacterium]
MLKDKDDLSWYARKAGSARAGEMDAGPAAAAAEGPVAELLAELKRDGSKGSFAARTLYTRRLPPGCRSCLGGKGSNLYVTGLCTRDCFFCFNSKPRQDELVVHGIKVEQPEEAAEIVTRYGLRSIGISGGEPLLFPDRVLRIIRSLRALPERVRIDLYTNGDLATDELLRQLKEAGLDALRFNLAARGYDTDPVERALRVFAEVTVEIPVIPAELEHQKAMVLGLDELGAPFLNIHELFSCAENRAQVTAEGGPEKAAADASLLLWKPVQNGEEAALRLLHFALTNTRQLSVYYCSCRTQETISERGLRRRRRLGR